MATHHSHGTTLAAASAIVCLLWASLAGAQGQTPAGAAPKVTILTSGKGGTSIVKDEQFVVQVDLPPGQPTPPTIQVKVKGPNGQDEPLTLTQKPGTSTYQSQVASVAVGAQKTGLASYLPGNLSREMDPIKTANGDSISVVYTPANGSAVTVKTPVYDSTAKQGIANVKGAIDKMWDQQVRKAEAADQGMKAVEEKLKRTTDPEEIRKLNEAKKLFERSKEDARTKLEILNHGLKQMNAPYLNNIMYPDQMRLALLTNYYSAALGGLQPGQRLGEVFYNANWNARQQAKDAWNDIQMQFWKEYTMGLYQAVATFSLAGPVFTLGTTAAAKMNYYVYGEGSGQGLTIFNQAATSDDLLHAAKELAVAAAMAKAMPAAVDALGGKLAGEFGASFTGGAGIEFALTSGGAAAATELGGRGGAGGRGGGRGGNAPAVKLSPKMVFEGAVEKEIVEGVVKRAEQAKAAGVPPETVDAIVQKGQALYESAPEGAPKINALAMTDFEIASEMFKLKNPGIVELRGDVAEIIRSIKVKTALEAQGKPQTYTPEEAHYIQGIRNEPEANLAKWVEVEDPFGDAFVDLKPSADLKEAEVNALIVKNTKLLEGAVEVGYTPMFDAADIKNIKNAANANLNVQAQTKLSPAQQKVYDAFKAAEAKAKLAAEEAAAQAAIRKANPPSVGQASNIGHQTEVLSPNDIKYVFTKKTPAGGQLQPTFNLATLKDQIVAKQVELKAKVAHAKAGAAADAFPNEVQIKAITPEQIRQMTPEMQAQLPLGKMTATQIKALGEAMGIPTGVPAVATGTSASASLGFLTGGKGVTDPKVRESVLEGRVEEWLGQESGAPDDFDVTKGWNKTQNEDGSVTYTSKDGKTVVKGKITGDNEIVVEKLEGEKARAAVKAEADKKPVDEAVPDEFEEMDAAVKKAIKGAGLAEPEYWLAHGNEHGGLTFESPDGKHAIDVAYVNGKHVVGTPYAKPPKEDKPAPAPNALGKDLCDSSAFWQQEADKAQGYADKATDPAEKARWTETAKWNANNARMREKWATENGFPCPPTPPVNEFHSDLFTPSNNPGFFLFPIDSTMNVGPIFPGIPTMPKVQNIIITADDDGVHIEISDLMQRYGASRGDVRAALAPGTLVELDDETQAGGRPMLSIVATGASTGDVFKVSVVNGKGQAVRVAAPDGLVLEPVETKAAVSAPGASSIEGYCVDFMKPPPAPGTQYRVAPAAVQKKYAPVRNVLKAARKIAQDGLLHPDSDPKSYLQFVKQYAVWTKIENWTPEKFADAFLDRTKKNFAALKRNWTKEVEQAVRSVIPGRWRDIQAVLQQAESLAAGAAGGQ
jgi:hypothetical protein